MKLEERFSAANFKGRGRVRVRFRNDGELARFEPAAFERSSIHPLLQPPNRYSFSFLNRTRTRPRISLLTRMVPLVFLVSPTIELEA